MSRPHANVHHNGEAQISAESRTFRRHHTRLQPQHRCSFLGGVTCNCGNLGRRTEVEWLRSFFSLRWLGLGGDLIDVFSPYALSQRKFFFDEVYWTLIVGPLKILAIVFYWADRQLVDGLVKAFSTRACLMMPPM